jgi:two-component system OmpR family sensor kinase
MSRLPIRVRLTAVFAAAMVVVLAGAALFVYARLRADLNEAVNASLVARADAVASITRSGVQRLGDGGPAAAGDPEEVFAQVLTDDGRVMAVLGAVREPALPPRLARAAARETLVADRRVRGLEGRVRVLARPLAGAPGTVVVVGQSLDDRDETLAGLVGSFAVGGPIAVLLASVLGYGLATAALRPVEAMRRRAAAVSLADDDAPLPLPRARDEIRRLGETLNAMLARLRRSFERERRFVADASHELRTPIAVLKTELETLLRRGGHPPDVHEALLAAAGEADQLARLAEDLLVLARSSEGRLTVRPERLDAAGLLDGARERFDSRAAAQGRTIDVDVVAGVTVDADPLRIRQALDNLLDNALRHGAGDVSLAARAAGNGVEIDVADAGPGFGDGLAERAFERFARGDDARTRGGTGLGLAIVRAVAEAHGGRAEIVPDRAGARVRLWLPASQIHLSAHPHDGGIRSYPT